MRRAGLTLRQLEVLAAVRAGGSLADIGARLRPKCSRVAVYNVVQRLAAGRYIQLEPERKLTAKGQRALDSAVTDIKDSLAAAEGV